MAVSKTSPRNRRFYEITPPPEPAPDLGPLTNLPGTWRGAGTGWNMIAVPFHGAPPPGGFNFRVLMNQYDEDLSFTFIDDKVPNRGLLRPPASEFDQLVVTLDYQQKISQTLAEDRPTSALAGDPGLAIHHEPGLWLHMLNLRSGDVESVIDLARLASIPHGNSVLALGHSARHEGMPAIPPLSGLPIGRFEDLRTPGYDVEDDPYLAPYKHYIDNPFMGNVVVPGFPGFSPADLHDILRFANEGVDIARTTTLTVDSTRRGGAVSNIPFVEREADPASMRSTFWIQELRETDAHGAPRLRLQYSQVVMLEFFSPRQDELPGRAMWPHVSIATLEKVPAEYAMVRDEPGQA